MKYLRHTLPHLVLMLFACMFSTFLILDAYNPAMKLVDNKVSNILLWVFCILSIICTIIWMYEYHRQEVQKNEEPQEWC